MAEGNGDFDNDLETLTEIRITREYIQVRTPVGNKSVVRDNTKNRIRQQAAEINPYESDRHTVLDLIKLGGLELAADEYGSTPDALIEQYKLTSEDTNPSQ